MTKQVILGAHFPGVNAGYIKTEGDAFRIEWDRP